MADETPDVNKESVNNALLYLGKNLGNLKPGVIEKAIEMLRGSSKSSVLHHTVKAVRGNAVDKGSLLPFISFGVPWMDEWTRGGARRKELILVGATPHAGKTHTLVWFGLQFLFEGMKVLDVIGEDLIQDVQAAYESGLAPEKATAALENLWLADVQDVKFGVAEIETIYNDLKAEGNAPDVIIVDHVDLMRSDISGRADWEAVSEVMLELKMFAKRTNTIVITASQANYGKDLKGNERFYRAKVGKAANADMIFMIDEVIDRDYFITLTKARGRSRIPESDRQKVLDVDWSTMKIRDKTQRSY